MKYELHFLNNIYDSIDSVNVEMDPFLDMFRREQYFDNCCIKHIICDLSNCFELLVKYRLMEEHWSLVFADVNKASFVTYENGDFISVDIKSAISRVQNICGVEQDFNAIKIVQQYRNRIMHYTLCGTTEEIIKNIANSMREIKMFVETEIIESLPEEAKQDFEKAMKDYSDNANRLEELKF